MLWFVANDTYSQTPQQMLGLINFLFTAFPSERKFHPNHSLYISQKLLPSCVFYTTNEMQLTQCSSSLFGALHVSGGISTHRQELIKLYVQPWVLSCFPAVYNWCGWVL